MKSTLHGLWIPLVTPFYRGSFDKRSMAALLDATKAYADGYVACLSSGEGSLLSDAQWVEAVDFVASRSKKPVIAGMLGRDEKKIVTLSKRAKRAGCVAMAIAVPEGTEAAVEQYFSRLQKSSALPILIYNTEHAAIRTVDLLQRITSGGKIVAIKDSTGDTALVHAFMKAKHSGLIEIAVLQGMENRLLSTRGCDGLLIALGNVEPKLCKAMADRPTAAGNAEVMRMWWRYNLGGTWYVTLKAILQQRKVLRSAEEVKQDIPA